MQKVIFLVGGYSVGKSTFIEQNFANGIWNEKDFVVVSIDNIISRSAKKRGLTHNQAYELSMSEYDVTGYDNIERCCDLIREILKGKKNIIIDNPNATSRTRKRYIDIIPRSYVLEAVYFEVNDEQRYLKRLQRRNNSEKSIDKGKALFLLEKIERPTMEEGFSEISIVSTI